MPYNLTVQGQPLVKATELVRGIYDQVQTTFEDVLYPEILWREVIPQESVKTDINPGALNFIYPVRDIKGVGQFVRGNPANIPRVGQVVGQVTVPILDAAIGATVTDMEATRYAMGFQSALAQDLGEVMKKATDYHIERTVFFGDVGAGFSGFLDYPTIPLITGASAWTGADPAVWVDAVNGWLATVWVNSKTVHLPGKVWLPPAKFAMLEAPYTIGSGGAAVSESAGSYLQTHNIYTRMTGKPLEIKALRYLTGAGAAGVDRAMVLEEAPRNLIFPFPLPYELAQPVPIPLGVDLYAIYVFGSLNWKYPASAAYIDGI